MLGWIAYIMVAILWGSTYFAIALGITSFTPYGLVSARFLAAALISLVLGRILREPWPSRSDLKHLIVVGTLLLGCANGLVVWAEQYVSSAITAVLMALTPFWLALFYLHKERLGAKGWLGLMMGLLGVAILVWPEVDQDLHVLGLLALFVAPMIWSFGTIYGRDRVKGGGLFTNVGIEMATAGVIGVPVAALSGGFLHAPLGATALWSVSYLALFGSLLGFSAFIYLTKVWPPAKAGTYAYLNPLVAVLLGTAFLHEHFGLRQFVGMSVILGSVAIVQMKAKTLAANAETE